MSRSFDRLLTETAETQRATVDTSTGKRSTPTTNLLSVCCTRIYPADQEVRQRVQLQTPHELHQVFCDDAVDVVEGDLWVQSSKTYTVRSVGDWPWRGTSDDYKTIVLEELKR